MLDKAQFIAVAKRNLLPMLILLGTSGCATNIVVKADIPPPLVEKLPLTGSITYTDKFKNYVYLEAEKQRRSLRSLDLATAQISLFDQIFGSLMTLVPEKAAPEENPNIDLIIEPEILDFQYTAPVETKLKQYEVWIKYRLKLRNQNNQKLADWTIKGYGKTPTGTLTSASIAFNSAATVALRDVGAQLSIRFAKQRTIKQLLAGTIPEPIIEEEVEPEPEIAEQEVAEQANQSKPLEQKTVEESDES